MSEERFIVICLYPFALLGLYHMYKWIGHMDRKNGMEGNFEKED